MFPRSSFGYCLTSALIALSIHTCGQSFSQDASARIVEAKLAHNMAQQRTGLLIPLYLYPADIHTNATYNRLIELKREHETIPFWVIVNPATGPGERIDQNYVKAVDRLVGAGCIVLGYVSTEYGKRALEKIESDLDHWRQFYPRAHGMFFDEMVNENVPSKIAHQRRLRLAADKRGYWPIVANPGTSTPEAYFKERVADVLVVHESDQWPDESKMKGDYFGGYADYPPFSRGILIHSMKDLDRDQVRSMTRYAKWIYVTHDMYRLNDPAAPNPWDELSVHLEALCRIIERSE